MGSHRPCCFELFLFPLFLAAVFRHCPCGGRFQTDFRMYGSPNDLRISWMFFGTTVAGQEVYDRTEGRMFELDRPLFDHFNLVVSEVRCRVLSIRGSTCAWALHELSMAHPPPPPVTCCLCAYVILFDGSTPARRTSC